MVSVRNKIKAVLLSIDDYNSLIGKKPNFMDFINQSPMKGVDLDIERDKFGDVGYNASFLSNK